MQRIVHCTYKHTSYLCVLLKCAKHCGTLAFLCLQRIVHCTGVPHIAYLCKCILYLFNEFLYYTTKCKTLHLLETVFCICTTYQISLTLITLLHFITMLSLSCIKLHCIEHCNYIEQCAALHFYRPTTKMHLYYIALYGTFIRSNAVD